MGQTERTPLIGLALLSSAPHPWNARKRLDKIHPRVMRITPAKFSGEDFRRRLFFSRVAAISTAGQNVGNHQRIAS
jgi:hypothetical protein